MVPHEARSWRRLEIMYEYAATIRTRAVRILFPHPHIHTNTQTHTHTDTMTDNGAASERKEASRQRQEDNGACNHITETHDDHCPCPIDEYCDAAYC